MTNFLRGCRLLWLAVTTGWLIAATTALAGESIWNHNGSIMRWVGVGPERWVSYLRAEEVPALIIDPPGQGQLPPWQRRTNVWRRVTSPGSGAPRQRSARQRQRQGDEPANYMLNEHGRAVPLQVH